MARVKRLRTLPSLLCLDSGPGGGWVSLGSGGGSLQDRGVNEEKRRSF